MQGMNKNLAAQFSRVVQFSELLRNQRRKTRLGESNHTRSKFRRRLLGGIESLENRQLLAADLLFADSFEAGQWNGNWVEDSQNDWFTSSQRSTDGNYSAEVDGYASNSTLKLSNPIDLSGYDTAELTFDWLIESGFDSGEYLALDISSDGGATWNNSVLQLNGNSDPENQWHSETVDLTPYASSNLVIQFRAKVSRSNEDANVDNVVISGIPTPSGPPEISIGDGVATEGGSTWGFADALQLSSEASTVWSIGFANASDGSILVSTTDSVTGASGLAKADPLTGEVDKNFVALGTAGLQLAKEIAVRDGWVYVANKGTSEILRFNEDTGVPDSAGAFVSSGSGGLVTPRGIAFDSNGDLYVADKDGDQILKYSGFDGSFYSTFVAAVDAPKDLAFDSADRLYVGAPDSVLVYDQSATIVNEIPMPGTAGAQGIELSADEGTILVAQPGDARILELDITTGALVNEVIPDPAFGPVYGVALDVFGNLLAATNLVDGDVLRFAPASSAIFSVELSSPSATPVTVDFTTAGGSASEGVDYVATSGQLTFEPAVTTRTIVVPTIDDALLEGDETFTVNLSNATGAMIADSQGVATIVDNEIPNEAPDVDAGSDQTLSDDDGSGVELAMLTGSATDSDGTVVSYEWNDGTNVLGTDPTLSASLPVGVHTLTLSATDNEGAVGSDSVTITVLANQGPSADAGSDQVVTDADSSGSEVVNLNGSGSDSDGSIVAYEWKEGTTVLGNTASISPSLSVGTHVLTLTVTDNGGAIATADVTIEVHEPAQNDPNALYVYDITFESRKRGRDHRAVFEIRSDNDANGTAGDARVSGVSIEVTFAGVTYTGTTDSNGVFRTNWRRLSSGNDYYANAVDLALSGYTWNAFDIAEEKDDSDGDGNPDEVLSL